MKKLLAVMCMGAVSSVAMAQDDNSNRGNGWQFQPEFSIGAGYGFTKLKDGEFDEDEAAKKVYGVVKFNEYIGVEASYIDFDEAGNGLYNVDLKGKALNVILELPVSQSFSVYAKGGQMWWDADTNEVDTSDFLTSRDHDGDETFWGLGAKFRLTEHLDLRLEYERFNFEISRDEVNLLQPNDIDMDVDFASINLQFTF